MTVLREALAIAAALFIGGAIGALAALVERLP